MMENLKMESVFINCINEIINHYRTYGKITKNEINKIKNKYSKGTKILKNSELIEFAKNKMNDIDLNLLKKILAIKRTRTISGVAPIAIMTISDCPHGRCIYCPKGDNSAQSYTGEEPASLRARQYNFDPYLQVQARLNHYKALGYEPEKCELIIMGGTFLSMNLNYIKWFMKGAYEGFNGKRSESLENAIKDNENALHRVVGTTFETKPDWCKEKHVDLMLHLGGTRVEIGVQVLDDETYKLVNRGHTLNDVIEATKIAKNAGYKICYHMMPGLFSDKQKDLEYFKKLFEDENFRPDMLKIYPTLVLPNTGLYNMWKKGLYKPYTNNDVIQLLVEIKKIIPKYVRIMRVQRDIPAKMIAAGPTISNARELALKILKAQGLKCKCIRCRELGIRQMYNESPKTDFELKIDKYNASGSTEYFISYEASDETLAGFIRLRDVKESHRNELLDSMVVRELHVYGTQIPLSSKNTANEDYLGNSFVAQHKGLGKNLLKKAEEIALEKGKEKIAIISGIGVREYYRKLGYELVGPYMVKNLR
ncbi:MAG: tRNA uridine(34) 5-carboxymethylaminomethyl modification radical SAM/GNAT enzyme Elp3 [Candidatus Micrarchaeota archaeon]|nr:tRNA uridine(34) 5-carboxymethylaminomethyl modification radical SAM/GNAT enzyme Elp3 [Candidatus Micrarchaeota archaeon]